MAPTGRHSVAAAIFLSAAGLLPLGCSGPQGTTPVTSPIAQASVSSAPTPALTPTPTATPAPTPRSDIEKASAAPPGAISIAIVKEEPRFSPDKVTARAGTAVFFIDNSRNVVAGPNGFVHNFKIGPAVGQPQWSTLSIAAGDSVIFTVKDLNPGTYAFWCSINNHYNLGMVGTLTVDP